MEDKGKIKVSLGVLLLIVLIVIVISVCATYFVLQKVNQDKPEKKEEQNTVTNSVQNLVKNEVKNQVKNEVNDPKNVVATGAFNHMKVNSEGYTIDINSEEVGHPDSESLFRTGFEIEEEDGTTKTFDVSYEKIFVYGKGSTLPTTTDQPIKINGKECYYSTDKKHETKIRYHIKDENQAFLYIKVEGINIFDKDGNDTGKTPVVDKDILESEELAGILNFEVEKE